MALQDVQPVVRPARAGGGFLGGLIGKLIGGALGAIGGAFAGGPGGAVSGGLAGASLGGSIGGISGQAIGEKVKPQQEEQVTEPLGLRRVASLEPEAQLAKLTEAQGLLKTTTEFDPQQAENLFNFLEEGRQALKKQIGLGRG